MECLLAGVIEIPFRVGYSCSKGIVESVRLIVHPVLAAMVWFMLGKGLEEVALRSKQGFNVTEFARAVASCFPQHHQLFCGRGTVMQMRL